MTARARVAVMGATPEEPPPGIGLIADLVDLAFADTAPTLSEILGDADVLLAWRAKRELLEDAWDRAGVFDGSSPPLRGWMDCCSRSSSRATSS